MATRAPHVPVLVDRVCDLLADAPPGVILDATLGAGGHARAILEARFGTAHDGAAPGGRLVEAPSARSREHDLPALVGLDRDPEAMEIAGHHLEEAGFADRVRLVHARFDRFEEDLDGGGIGCLAGVLLDLGVSSMQLDETHRGFGYRADGPLDMRMDPSQEVTAGDLVNSAPVEELTRIIVRHGEERHARRIAVAIGRARPVTTTGHLAEVVRDAIPAAARRRGGHPATRTFQALRIAVNSELDVLEDALPRMVDRLCPGGIAVVLAYHSLEDRIVKQVFARAATGCVCPPGLPVCGCGRRAAVEHVVRRPERPGPDEVAANPRSRSARLRAVRRLPGEPPKTQVPS